jgi:hypothetical protein
MNAPLTSRLALLTCVTVACWTAFSAQQRRAQVPTLDEWRTAVSTLTPHLQPGDVVSWRPEWADEVRVALSELEKRVEVRYPPHHGAWELGRARRLWVLSAHGRRGEELVTLSRLKGEARAQMMEREVVSRQPLSLERVWRVGPVEVSVLHVGGSKSITGLYEDLDQPQRVSVRRRRLKNAHQARVAQDGCELWALEGWHCHASRSVLSRVLKRSLKGSLKQPQHTSTQHLLNACLARPLEERLKHRSKRRYLYTLDRRRYLPYVDCGLHPTEHVSRDVRVIGGEPRRCVWLSPHEGRALEVTWRPQLSTELHGAPTLLSLSFGWEDLAVDPPFRVSKARPLDFEISVNSGSGLGLVSKDHSALFFNETLSPSPTWRTLDLPLKHALSTPAATTTVKAVTIKLSAPQGAQDAHLCVDVTLKAPPKGSP